MNKALASHEKGRNKSGTIQEQVGKKSETSQEQVWNKSRTSWEHVMNKSEISQEHFGPSSYWNWNFALLHLRFVAIRCQDIPKFGSLSLWQPILAYNYF